MVEIPKGSHNKYEYEYDTKRGVIKFDRVEGWEGLDAALRDIKEAQERFKKPS